MTESYIGLQNHLHEFYGWLDEAGHAQDPAGREEFLLEAKSRLSLAVETAVELGFDEEIVAWHEELHEDPESGHQITLAVPEIVHTVVCAEMADLAERLGRVEASFDGLSVSAVREAVSDAVGADTAAFIDKEAEAEEEQLEYYADMADSISY